MMDFLLLFKEICSMITREQIYTMLMMNNRRDTFFSVFPTEIIKEISDYGQNPNSEIATALSCLQQLKLLHIGAAAELGLAA
jgi:hypothetical protein